jgi:hypothetical protein
MGEMINAYRIFVENPDWKRPFGRLRRIWEVIIMDL